MNYKALTAVENAQRAADLHKISVQQRDRCEADVQNLIIGKVPDEILLKVRKAIVRRFRNVADEM